MSYGYEYTYGVSHAALILGAGLGTARISISNRAISELAPSGSTIGDLAVSNGQGVYVFTIVNDPDNKFTIVANQLRTDAALDFETTTSHSVTIRADNGSDDPVDLTVTVTVINAFEGPTFNPLTLSVTEIVAGVPIVIDILGATAGSTIEGTVPDGMGLDGPGRTIAGTPTTSGQGISLTESGLDSEPVTTNPAVTVQDPEALSDLTLPAEVSRGSVVTLQGTTAGSTFEVVSAPSGWTLDPNTGQFDIAVTADLGTQSWSVREISSNPLVQPRVSSGTTDVVFLAPPLDFIAYGQSNLIFWATRSDSETPAPHPDTFAWDPDTDQWGAPAGEGAIRFLNAMQAATGRVCRLVWGGQSGVPISFLQKNAGTGHYEAFMDDIIASGVDPQATILHHGEGNAAGTGTAPGAYAPQVDTLHGDLAADTGKTRATLPIVLSSLATTTSGSVQNDENWAAIQNELATINGSYPHIHFSHSNVPATLLDAFHWNAASYGKTGSILPQTVLVLMAEETVRPNWTLDLVGERISTTQTRVNVIHSLGNDFTPTSGITGFEVSGDAGNNWIIATGAREDADSIVLDHANLGTSTRLIRYQYGRNPVVSGAVLDNSPLQVPLQYTVGSLVAPGEAASPILTHHNSFEVGGGDVHSGTIPLAGVTEESLCVLSGQHRGNVELSSLEVTAQPSGTVLTPILVDEDAAGNRPTAFLYRMVAPANTTSLDIVAPYDSNTFSRAIYHAWTSPVSGLNSLVPVDQASVRETASASVTGSPATSAGGFVIALGVTRNTSGIGTLSGDEIYNVRDQQEKSNFSWVVGDTQDVAANADSDVRATFDAADSGGMVLVAGSWR